MCPGRTHWQGGEKRFSPALRITLKWLWISEKKNHLVQNNVVERTWCILKKKQQQIFVNPCKNQFICSRQGPWWLKYSHMKCFLRYDGLTVKIKQDQGSIHLSLNAELPFAHKYWNTGHWHMLSIYALHHYFFLLILSGTPILRLMATFFGSPTMN